MRSIVRPATASGAFLANASRRTLSDIISSNAAASAIASPGGTSTPYLPSARISAAPPGAEVAITGTVMTASGPRPVLGQIDRLAVTADAVLLADFKSTRQLPDPDEALPDSQLLQLALYRQLLQELHPAKPVRTLLVFTRGPSVREIEPAALDAALARL